MLGFFDSMGIWRGMRVGERDEDESLFLTWLPPLPRPSCLLLSLE